MKRGRIVLILAIAALASVTFFQAQSPSGRADRPKARPEAAEPSSPVVMTQEEILSYRARRAKEDAGRPAVRREWKPGVGRSSSTQGPANREVREAWEREQKARRLELREKNGEYSNNNGTRIVHFDSNRVELSSTRLPDGSHDYVRYALERIAQAGQVLATGGAAQPRLADGAIVYDRGVYQEQYQIRDEGMEQLFVIPALTGTGDLVVSGSFDTNLTPVATGNGVSFRNASGVEAAYYKEAFVVDAAGNKLSIPISFTGGSVTLTVPQAWLATAAFPVTIDPLLGTAFTVDASITQSYFRTHDVVWNSVNSEYVVFWNEEFSVGDTDVLFARYTSTGGFISSGYVDAFDDELEVQASYMPSTNSILIVWADSVDSGAGYGYEVYGIVMNGGTDTFLSVLPFFISTFTNDGIDDFYADVATDNTNWLVVWNRTPSTTQNSDVYAQLVTSGGVLSGANFTLVADGWDSIRPTVAFNGSQYQTAWSDHSTTSNTGEIWGGGVTTAGAPTGFSQFSGAADGVDRDWPDVAGNSTNLESLVVWHENASLYDVATPTGNVSGRRISDTGAPLGTGQFAIQNDGGDEHAPGVFWNSTKNQYLVMWGEGAAGSSSVIRGARIGGGADTILENDIVLGNTAGSWIPVGASASNSESLIAYFVGASPFQLVAQRFDFNYAPNAPASLTQHDDAAGAAQPVGYVDDDGTLVFKAVVTDTDTSDLLTLRVEIQPIGTAFNGTVSGFSTPTPSGGTAVVTIAGVTLGSYHWQAWVTDNFGGTSATVAFGGNADPNDTDFSMSNPPLTPSSLSQHDDPAGPAEAVGWTDNDSSVTFKGIVTDGDVGQTVKLQIEIALAGVAFTGAVSGESGLLPSGSLAEVTIAGLAVGSYHWQARTVDSMGIASAWVSFGANPETSTDFAISTNTNPNVPSGLNQFKSDGTTIISIGGSTDETTVIFKGTVSDPDNNNVQLQVEVKQTGVVFDGTGILTGTLVSSGSLSQVTASGLSQVSYHWRARTIDSLGATSAWVNFGGNGEPNGIDFSVDTADVPNAPSSLGQFKLNGTTVIPIGGTTDENGVVIKAIVSDPDVGQTVKLQVEVKNTSTPFDGTGLVESALIANGSQASVTVPGLNPNNYHWRCRAVDNGGLIGPWVSFGANLETDADFQVVTPNNNPSAPVDHNQYKSDTVTLIALGATTNEATVVFKATVNDSDGGQTVQLQIELQAVGTPFTNAATASSSFVASGSVATVTVNGLAQQGYHWQARAVDNLGGASAWVSFGGNGDPNGVDFTVDINDLPIASGLGQFKTDDSVIPVGGQTTETSVKFKATLTDADAGQTIKLQVEVKALGTAFDGNGLIESAFVASGSVAEVTATSLAASSYHWRARGVDNLGGVGAWVTFGGNTEAEADFTVVTNSPPNDPTGLAQFEADGTTPIAIGGYTLGTTVVLKATISDLNGDTVKLQVEVRDIGTSFTPAFTHESALIASGSVASVTVAGLAANTNFHWQARVVDSNGAASNWVVFGGNGDVPPAATDFFTNTQPADPILLDQTTMADVSIPVGGSTAETTFKAKATVSDADAGQTMQLQVEIKPVGTNFNGTTNLFTSALAAGGVHSVTVNFPGNGNYHWRCRTLDQHGAASNWVVFGGNTDPNDVDIAASGANFPPNDPTGLGQFKSNGVTAIAIGGSTDEDDVDLKATVSDPDGGTVSLEVEVKPIGTPFDGLGTQTGPAVASGLVATVEVLNLANNTSFHWRARATDGTLTSNWVSFGGNPESSTDFTVAVNTPPNAPAGLAQFKSDGTTSIPTGGTTNESTLVVKGTVSDADSAQTLQLQVEIKTIGTPFDGLTGITSSPFVANGAVATATITGLANASYHWQARVVDSAGGQSGWTSFGGNADPGDTDVTVAVPAGNNNPSAPSGLEQYKADAISAIPVGSTTNENTVVFKGVVSDPDGNPVKLQVEIKLIGVAFTGTVSGESAFVASGTEATVTITGIANGSYHWQAWAVDSNGALGAAVAYGGNPDPAGTDFTVDTTGNTAPAFPTGLGQYQLDTVTAIPVGGTTSQSGVVFKALISDSDVGQSVKLQVEVLPIGVVFTGTVSGESAFVAPGTVASVTITGLANGSFHWRCRTADSAGGFSPWIAFGGNSDPGDADFTVNTVGNAPPSDPSGLGQFKSDGATAIVVGTATNENQVIFRGTVSDPNGDTVKLQVEVQTTVTAFTGTPSAESAFVASGQTASLLVSGFADQFYHWRARTVDVNGATSNWVSFGGNPDGNTDFQVDTTSNQVPNVPAGLNQTRTNGPSIAVGGSTNETVIHLVGTVTDPDAGGLLRLQVELLPIGAAFTGTPTASSAAVANGSTVTIVHGGLANGTSYHWRARTIDSNNVASGWVSFGGNPDGTTDFTKVPNSAPSAPAALDQLFTFGNQIPIGTETNETTVQFTAQLSDPDGDVVRLQIEVRPVGFAFTNGVMATSGPVGSGSTASILFPGLVNGTSYHWQVRTIDSSGATSAWVSFGGNPETVADFIVNLSAVLNFPGSSNRSGGGGGCGCLGFEALLVVLVWRRRWSRRRG